MASDYSIEDFGSDLVLAERTRGLAFGHPSVDANLAEHVITRAAFARLVYKHQAHVALVV